MVQLYKLTDAWDRTYNATQWGPGVAHRTSGKGEICSPGWLHAYRSPLLAVLMNPQHGNFDAETMHLWAAVGDVPAKCSCARS